MLAVRTIFTAHVPPSHQLPIGEGAFQPPPRLRSSCFHLLPTHHRKSGNVGNVVPIHRTFAMIATVDSSDSCSRSPAPITNSPLPTACPARPSWTARRNSTSSKCAYSHNLNSNDGTNTTTTALNSIRLACTSSTDAAYIAQWGQQRFGDHYIKYGITTIRGWQRDSGLRPCAVYLRHCYLAAKSMGGVCFNSFLDDTCLIDRKTTVREYVQQYPDVLEVEPPDSLRERYSG